MIRESSISTLVTSSAIAGCFSGMFTNILEVIKTQIMNDALMGKEVHGRMTHISRITHTCHCYFCFIGDLFRKNGVRTIFKGIGYNTAMSIVRSSILFPLYEYRRSLFTGSSKSVLYLVSKDRIQATALHTTRTGRFRLEANINSFNLPP